VSDVIFARPRHEYGSYVDLYRLIELSGYPLMYFDEIDPASDNVYICTMVNGENQNGWPDAAARIVLYDLEWRLNGQYPVIPGVAEVWAADKWYAERIGARYVPLGSHPNLPPAPLQDCPKVWDVAMLAYLPPRRERIVHECEQQGVSVAPRGWGLERHAILQQTKIMLHVHQHDGVSTVAPQRWAIAAAYRMPIISEQVEDKGIFGYSHGLWCDYGHLAEFARLWRDDARLGDYALALHDLLCYQLPFRRSMEQAL
jgi:hypothetical protein